MLKIAFGEEAMCRTQTYEWWKRFKDGRTSVDDDPRSGRPSTSKTDDNIAKVREVIRSNRRLTVREVSEVVSIWFLQQGFNPLKPSGHYMYHQFNIQQLYVLPTHCICVFCVDLRTKSHYFPIQH